MENLFYCWPINDKSCFTCYLCSGDLVVITELLQDWAAASAEPQTRSPCCSMKIRLKILKAMQLTMMTKSPKYSLGTRGKPVGRGQKPPSQVLHQRQLNQVKNANVSHSSAVTLCSMLLLFRR